MARETEVKKRAEEEKAARVVALKELGHSGEPEKHKRAELRHLDGYGLVYETTARRLLGGLSRTRFRTLVLPAKWVTNPVYTTAPKVPVYDPRTLLLVKDAFARGDEAWIAECSKFVSRRRAQLDDEIRSGYAEFRDRAETWRLVKEERRRDRALVEGNDDQDRGNDGR